MDAPLDQTPKVSSKQFALNWHDFLRGFIVAVGGSVFALIQTSLEAGQLNFNWKQIAIVGGGSACAYLAKNFFQPAVIQIKATPQETVDPNMDKTAK